MSDFEIESLGGNEGHAHQEHSHHVLNRRGDRHSTTTTTIL
jgi:hypothetical protein